MASRELQGWHPDPFGLHEMRYFSAGRPTKLVRDGRVDAYDEPPGAITSAGAASGAQGVAVGSEQATGVRAEAPVTALASPVISATTTSPAVPEHPDQAAPTRAFPPVQTDTVAPTGTFPPIQADHAAPAVAFPPLPVDQVAALAARSPVARRQRRWVEYAFVAAGAVVAVLVFVALAGRGSGKPAVASAAFVTKAAHQTLAEHNADFSLSATAQVEGETVAIGGNGQIDLANGSMSLNVGASTSAGSITENELEVGGNSYVKVTENGKSLPISGGRQWIEMPFSPTAGTSFGTGSPDSSLELLSQQGARVTSLGSRSIGGQNCEGYSVIPSSQAMEAGAKQEFAKIGLSGAQTNAALQALRNTQPPTITVWFSSTTNLTCQVTFSMQFGAPTSSGTGRVQSELTFTHYGMPVTIAAPSASDTVSLQQYLRGVTKL